MARALLALVTMIVLVLAAQPAEAAALPSKAVWRADVRQAMRGSDAFIARRVQQPHARLAIVLDIDNTSIATHYAWPRPVRRTLRFAQHARSLGYGVFFVTGRYQDTLPGVRPVLRRAGYPITGMCGRQHGERLVHSKQRCRTLISRRGWTITANVGNSRTDLIGGSFERGFKLPSYGGQLS
ncbi:HAD family acid phosphatase [Nocardioides sp. CER19]|uniref:HAD family acid phosphatase n=1 Tax=Nocardioides sp. CER19 TaxID=3038538 RepID=UPI002449B171|nr:HAD family acid phosphatase [Nocardioides sp. CER19]MDH2415700.1 HAD family acid phosphatase [Nocardioides sp. CER19]